MSLVPETTLKIHFIGTTGQELDITFYSFYRGPQGIQGLPGAPGEAGAPGTQVITVPTFSAIPASPAGFYLVLADESKNGASQMYFFTPTHRYWLAMVQDA